MKKEITIDDVLELVKLVHQVHIKTKHYASIDFSNYGNNVNVYVRKGGFRPDRPIDLLESINIYKAEKTDLIAYQKTADYLIGLLNE